MALQVWLPLDGDLHNQGLSSVTVTNNGATVDSNGKIGKCYIASGSINYSISCTGTNLSNLFSGTVKYSFSCWVKSVMRSGWIVKLGTSNNIGLWFGLNDARWVWADSDNGKRITTVANSEDTTNWHHITVIVDKTTISSIKYKFYFDGQLTVNTTDDGSSKTQPTGDSIIIYPYYGQIQDIRLYDHALSPKGVEEIAKGLVLHYQLADAKIGTKTNILSSAMSLPTSGWTRWIASGGTNSTLTYSTENGEEIITSTGTSQTVGTALGPYQHLSGDSYFQWGKTYTFSCYIKAAGSAYVGKWVWISYWNNNSQILSSGNKECLLTSNWVRHSVTITFKDVNPGSNAINLYIGLSIPTPAQTGGSAGDAISFQCTKFMLEEGPAATDWIEGGTSKTYSTVYDSSGYRRNGTIVGTLTAAAGSPRYEVATTFPTASDYFYFPHLVDSTAMNNEFTFSCWLYRDYTDATARYIYYGLCRIYLYTDFSPRIYWQHASADLSYDSANTWAPGIVIAAQTWTHLVFTFKNGVLYYYVNGVQYGPSDRSGTGQFIHGTQGSPNASIGYTWIGKISDVRTYATALTVEQVKELYNTSMLVDASGNVSPRELGDLI